MLRAVCAQLLASNILPQQQYFLQVISGALDLPQQKSTVSDHVMQWQNTGGCLLHCSSLQSCCTRVHKTAYLKLFFLGCQFHTLATATQCSLDQHWEAHSPALLAQPAPYSNTHTHTIRTLVTPVAAKEGLRGAGATGVITTRGTIGWHEHQKVLRLVLSS